ncbi:hypothetical protein CDAR_267941 [Caerostris darwini]|uniref:Uncharacterized protein n=1 Tax=Caerostris darwini TaxID=1538125 RepID=A0AAV4RMD3_9ARAC|nr:hypothetical protein CDAR_267941 [Caerostris darwini]
MKSDRLQKKSQTQHLSTPLPTVLSCPNKINAHPFNSCSFGDSEEFFSPERTEMEGAPIPKVCLLRKGACGWREVSALHPQLQVSHAFINCLVSDTFLGDRGRNHVVVFPSK